jgi:hypothetical protein
VAFGAKLPRQRFPGQRLPAALQGGRGQPGGGQQRRNVQAERHRRPPASVVVLASWAYAGNDTLEHDWVPVPHLRSWAPEADQASFRVELQRAAEERHLLDAFGVFAVPATDPAPASAHWTGTPVGPLTLWQHDDPAAWFGTDTPSPDVLTAARSDLRELLP